MTLIGIIASLSILRFSSPLDEANIATCRAQAAEIELQAQLWRRATGSFPSADLSVIGANPQYFPEGLPTSPVDGLPYAIDPATGRVVSHVY